MTDNANPLQNLNDAIAECCSKRIPFGKFGPDFFPPSGVLLCDLPYEYLRWFAAKGFPRNRLGQLMSVVYQIKRDGAEAVFNSFREGPPQSLRQDTPRRSYQFDE